MRFGIYYRITPTRTFVWNSWWHRVRVRPKKNLFMIEYEPPYHRVQTKLWIDFLKTTHGRSRLFLHTIKVWHTRKRTRILRKWEGQPLYEVMVNVKNYGHMEILKTVPV